MIRPAEITDASDICRIYNDYIANSKVTFEEEILEVEEIASRIRTITVNYPWLVYVKENTVVGYTYATKWKDRSAYRHTVEVGIYINSLHRGTGIGTKLTEVLLDELRKRSVHSVLCGITLPNPASTALYEKFGFKKVAHFKETGLKFNDWIDVGYWQLVL